jgi:DNA-binding NarL/FixJ family response regulator
MNTSPQISVIVAHRSTLLCEVLRDALQNRNYQVNTYATNGEDALRVVKVYQPDVVIMSNDLPNVSGVEVVNDVRGKGIKSKFMFLSQNEAETQFLNNQTTVEGHIHAWANMSEFFYCLQEIASGRLYVSTVIEKFINEASPENADLSYDPTVLKNLTPREKEIMKALSKFYTTPKIADMFFISTATVNNHRAKIMEKLNLRGRNQLLSVALSLRPYFA